MNFYLKLLVAGVINNILQSLKESVFVWFHTFEIAQDHFTHFCTLSWAAREASAASRSSDSMFARSARACCSWAASSSFCC